MGYPLNIFMSFGALLAEPLLRGVARTRQAAFAAILCGATHAGSFADGGMAGAENAWGASGEQVHGGAPPQLQTGGGTSPRLLALGLAHSSLDQHLSYVVFLCPPPQWGDWI